ncbi:hypothetical protein STEG23_033405 [Scotinomys teguina]
MALAVLTLEMKVSKKSVTLLPAQFHYLSVPETEEIQDFSPFQSLHISYGLASVDLSSYSPVESYSRASKMAPASTFRLPDGERSL